MSLKLDIMVDMTLQEIAKELVRPGKGILAADESNPTAGKRLARVKLENTEDNRRVFRDMLLNTTGIENYLSGVILYDETFRQKGLDGELFRDNLNNIGVMPGIKVDKSTTPLPGFPGEVITEGLDGLADRLQNYASLGAKFTKWRGVIKIDEQRGLPTLEAIHLNVISLARYARMVQDAGMVPMVEPEVLLEGTHTLERSREVILYTLSHLFYEMERLRVDLSAVILKTSMALDGGDDGIESLPADVAEATITALMEAVPDEVPGVVFLSGGQDAGTATKNLNALAKREPLPWELAFSFSRAIQNPVINVWGGKMDNIPAAREKLLEVLEQNIKADRGES